MKTQKNTMKTSRRANSRASKFKSRSARNLEDGRTPDQIIQSLGDLLRLTEPDLLDCGSLKIGHVAGLTKQDVANALSLLEYLMRCHRAALVVPGVDSALKSSATLGIHMDPGFLLVERILYEARCFCQSRFDELERREALK